MCSEFWFSAQWLPSGFLCPEQQWDASWPPAVLAVGPWDLYLAWWDSPSGTSAAYIHPTAARPGHLEQSGGQSNHAIKSSCPHPACLQHFESLQLIYYAHEHETQFKKNPYLSYTRFLPNLPISGCLVCSLHVPLGYSPVKVCHFHSLFALWL